MPKWRWPLFVLGACALALMSFSLLQIDRLSVAGYYGTALDNPVQVGDFTLTSASGEAVLSDWRGKYLLVFFGFTRCPDVCPLTLGRLAKTYRDLGEPEDVQVVMVSFDPETDTPARLERYLEGFHPLVRRSERVNLGRCEGRPYLFRWVPAAW